MHALEPGTCLGTRVDSFQDSGLRLNRTAYLPDQPTGVMHCHQNAHISLVLQGGNLEKKRAIQLERLPGCVTFYQPEELHQTIHKQFPAQHINLEIDDSFLSQHQMTNAQLGQGIHTAPDCAITLLKLYREFQQTDCFSAASRGMLIQQLLGESLTGFIPPWVNMIKELMQDRWHESITLTELATAAGVHPVTISKYFPKYFQATLGEYMRKLRVTKAIAFIHSPHRSLTDIAYQCGFADQSHFTRTFHQLTGFTPKQFRQL